MSTGVASEKKLWTSEELLAMPDDGVERWIIRGELREARYTPEDAGKTKRNRFHSITEGRVTAVLGRWLVTQPEPRGEVVCGEVGFRLQRDPDTAVGIDVTVVSAEMAAADPDDTTMFDGVPLLAVEILSPSSVQEEWLDKVDDYIEFGTPIVWVLEPRHRTVTVFRPNAEPELFNRTQTLSADPVLPGFSCPVADLFR
jgi:Uma2 family endonuclease